MDFFFRWDAISFKTKEEYVTNYLFFLVAESNTLSLAKDIESNKCKKGDHTPF